MNDKNDTLQENILVFLIIVVLALALISVVKTICITVESVSQGNAKHIKTEEELEIYKELFKNYIDATNIENTTFEDK